MKSYVLTAFLILVSFSAYGKPVNVHGFRFSNTLEAVSMEDALSPNSELIRSQQPILFRAAFDYSRDNLSAATTKNSNSSSFVDHLYSVQLGAGVLLMPRILIGVTTPLHFMKLSQSYVSGQFDESAWKLGDTTIDAKIRFSGDRSKWNLAFRPHLTIPTGNKTYLLTDDSIGWGGRVLVDRSFDRWTWFMHAGYSHATHAQLLSIDRRHLLDLGLGTFYRLDQRFGLHAEWLQSISIPDLEGGQNPTQIHMAIRYDSGRTKLFAGGGVQGFGFSDGNKPYMFFVGMKHGLGKGSQPVRQIIYVDHAPKNENLKTVEQAVQTVDSVFEKDMETLSKMVVYFDNNRAQVKKSEHKDLDEASQKVLQYKDKIQYLVLKGHTDPRGEERYNKKLSEQRAMAVKNALIKRGINEHKILIDGYGESELKSKQTKEYPSNRRVEFQVVEK